MSGALDRRSLLALAATGSFAVAASPAQACSIALPPPDLGAAQLKAVFELMRLWWARDEEGFFARFDGSRLPTAEGREGLQDWLKGSGKPVADAYAATFTVEGRYRQVQAITIVDGRAFVSVLEHTEQGLGPDCSGAPSAIQLLVDFRDEIPVGVTILDKSRYWPAGQVTHWTGAG